MWEKDPQKGVIDHIPKDVIVMADTDRGGKFTLFGKRYINDEYSLTYVGPSERFKKTAGYLKSRGQTLFGRTQIGTTHEAGTIPFLPVMQKVYQKYVQLRRYKVKGLMETWNFGNFLSPVTELANEVSWSPLKENKKDILLSLATRHYGSKAASIIYKAWDKFSYATNWYPRCPTGLSRQPLNYGPSFPLVFEKNNMETPYSWLDSEIKNHRLEDWIILPFTCGVFVKAFKKVAKEWEKGLEIMKKAIELSYGVKKKNLLKDIAVAECFLIQLKSNILITEFTYLRDKYYVENNDKIKKNLIIKIKSLCKDYLDLNKAMRTILKRDNRLGFHGEAHCYLLNRKRLNIISRTTKTLLGTIKER